MSGDQRRKYFQNGCNLLSREYPRNSEREKPSYSKQKKKTQTGSDDSHDVDSDTDEVTTIVQKKTSSHLKQVLFTDIKLHPNLLNAVQNLRYVTLKQVQVDVLFYFTEYIRGSINICAPRKCGKTTAALLCILNEIMNDMGKIRNQALILCPTLELAELCYLSVQQLVKFSSLEQCLAVRGKNFKSDKITESIIIATPDKALSILSSLDFKKIHYFFIDDADCLKNPKSQFRIIGQLFRKMSTSCRTILTSDSKSIFIDNFFKEYIELSEDITIEQAINYKNVKQLYVVYKNPDEKLDVLVHLVSTKLFPGQVVIFCETTEVVAQLEELLQSKNFRALKLLGSLPLTQRNDVLKQFKNKDIKILITTCAFLRVIPTNHIAKVINFEQLFDSKEGLHLEEYERRKYLLNETNDGVYVNLVDEIYKKFFFHKNMNVKNGKTFYFDAEIITIEELKNL